MANSRRFATTTTATRTRCTWRRSSPPISDRWPAPARYGSARSRARWARRPSRAGMWARSTSPILGPIPGATRGDFGPQLGTSVKIDTGDSRLDNCLLRNGTIWCAHTVFVPYGQPTRAAAQWFQIDPSGTTPALVQRGRIDDPSGTFFYAYPTIAVNKNNEALIGYTRFSANDYASAMFAIRTPTDPLSTMQPGVLLKAGESTYVSPGARSGSNRWGDYSATVVDPANDVDFWTIQEYAATPPSTRTGAFGTWWAQVSGPFAGSNCTYTLAPANTSFDSSGGSGAGAVNTAAGLSLAGREQRLLDRDHRRQLGQRQRHGAIHGREYYRRQRFPFRPHDHRGTDVDGGSGHIRQRHGRAGIHAARRGQRGGRAIRCGGARRTDHHLRRQHRSGDLAEAGTDSFGATGYHRRAP